MNLIKGFMKSALLIASLGLMVFSGTQYYTIKDTAYWKPVPVKIINLTKINSNIFIKNNKVVRSHFKVTIKNLITNEKTSQVKVKVNDFIGRIDFVLSQYFDQDIPFITPEKVNYKKEQYLVAYASPDGKQYILKQNTADGFIVLFFIGLFLPLVLFSCRN